MLANLETHGFTLIPKFFTQTECSKLIQILGPVTGAGRRGLLSIPLISQLANSPKFLNLIRPHLSKNPTPVRSIYFDKSPDANWVVSWHQDLTIALNEHSEIPGFGPWSVKDGIPHVQPPSEFLQKMLTLRLHLDSANESNGALRVLPGSHLAGKLSPQQIQEQRQVTTEHLCNADAGDVLLMRPLLLHASGRSSSQNHRRILHIEYAGLDLPNQARWNLSA